MKIADVKIGMMVEVQFAPGYPWYPVQVINILPKSTKGIVIKSVEGAEIWIGECRIAAKWLRPIQNG